MLILDLIWKVFFECLVYILVATEVWSSEKRQQSLGSEYLAVMDLWPPPPLIQSLIY